MIDSARVLREARRRAGLTQRELAARAGVAQPAIARIERGTVTPRVDTLERLLEHCGARLEVGSAAGSGVDRTLARGLLEVSVEERFEIARASALGYAGFRIQPPPERVAERGPAAADIASILQVLHGAGVEFVVIGGAAAFAHGAPIVTYDFDICYRRSTKNILRLAQAARYLGATLRGLPPGLPNVVDADYLQRAVNVTFDTIHGPLDCLGEPAGAPGFDAMWANAAEAVVFGLPVRIAAISDLISMKRAADRPKDRAHIEELAALQAEIDHRNTRDRRADS